MAVKKIDVDEFISLASLHPVIDVRSPGEFAHAHFPNAFSLPLFSDNERKVVGTLYKQKGREAAIKQGLDFFGPTMKKKVEDVEEYLHSIKKESKTVLVHCWRGGMRSAAIAWLLDLYGFDVYQLNGGYKAFRNWVLQKFTNKFQFRILGGYTGSGKTKVLEELKRIGHNVIDLEGLANHKGSAFGALGEKMQPSQEMFENLLATNLHYKNVSEKMTWLEDESQRIGQAMIPAHIWNEMRSARVFFLEIDFEERLTYLVDNYGKFPQEQLVNSILRISKRLGGLETKNAINFLIEKNVRSSFGILLNYYDKLYFKGLQNRKDLSSQLVAIKSDTVDAAASTKNLLNSLIEPAYGIK